MMIKKIYPRIHMFLLGGVVILLFGIFIGGLSIDISKSRLNNGVVYAQAGNQTGNTSGGTSQAATDVCEGVTMAGGGSCTPGGDTESTDAINNLIAVIVNIFSWVVGVIAVIMIIWGGFSIVTAGGDAQKVGNGRKTITYALVGLVIVAMAQIIVRFVLGKVTA
jgi:hypothetical protein